MLLLDEPTSALDPISTAKIEELISELKKDYTIAIVTHNMQQAARVSDYTAYMYLGELIEFGATDEIFIKPKRRETEGLHYRQVRLIGHRRPIEERNMNEHTYKQFDAEMEEIRSGVMAMGGLVETQLARAIEALKHTEADLIDPVAADERAINQMQVDIDQLCSQIIAKRQPTAIDLRMVLTVVKIVNELERAGDEVKKIVYKAQQMQRPERLSSVRFHEITRAAELAESNLQLALDAFARLDVAAAAQVISNDEAIDFAFLSILRQLISYMMEDPRTITPALEIVFIAKSIERVGDHAKNIAENVVHVVKGKDVRHATAEQIRAEVAE